MPMPLRVEEGDLVAGERIVAEGRDVVGRAARTGQRPQRPQRVQRVAGKAHAPVCPALAGQFQHAFADRRRYRFPPCASPPDSEIAIAFRSMRSAMLRLRVDWDGIALRSRRSLIANDGENRRCDGKRMAGLRCSRLVALLSSRSARSVAMPVAGAAASRISTCRAPRRATKGLYRRGDRAGGRADQARRAAFLVLTREDA